MTKNTIQGRVIITGGTKGIGKAVAEEFAAHGCPLLLTFSSDEQRARETQNEIQQHYNTDVHIVRADIAATTSIELIANNVKKDGRPIGAIIFNAGITDRTPFPLIDPEKWNSVMQANVNFPLFLLQTIDQYLHEGSSVTFTGSAMGVYPHSVSLAYGVTKEATHSLVKNLVKFYAERHIRINAIAPGFIDTEWQKEKPEEIRKNIESKIALGHFCQPADLAQLYWTVASHPYLNGAIINADGGYNYR